MQTGDNLEYFKQHFLSADVICHALEEKGWASLPRKADAGPAIEYCHPNHRGKIGIISPYSKDFCVRCNRLRISAQGNLHLCLFTDLSYSLRQLLQEDAQKEALKQIIQKYLTYKKSSHFLDEGITGINSQFSSIGG